MGPMTESGDVFSYRSERQLFFDAVREGMRVRVDISRTDSVCVFGTDSCSIAGEVLSDAADELSSHPLTCVRDGRIPGWVGPGTEAIMVSYEGDCPEAVPVLEALRGRGCGIHVLTAGGTICNPLHPSEMVLLPMGLEGHEAMGYVLGALAATVQAARRVEVSAFYSHRTLDGRVEDGVITSIDESGLHRTSSEVEKMHTFSQQLAGGNVSYQNNHFQAGLTGIYYFFDRPYEPNLREYAKYNLRGNRFYNIGLNYRYRLGRFGWSGEAALGKHGCAFLNRWSYDFSPDYRLLLVHRYYAHDYWAMFAHAFGEGSTPQNENGWYMAAEAAPFAYWRFFASADFFSFPWWRYRISKPSQGMEIRFQATYTPREDLTVLANYRFKRRERDVTGTGGEETWPTWHQRVRFRLTYAPGAWRLQTTADYNRFLQQTFLPSQGWQCTQSVGYALPGIPLAVSLQATYFDTDDYDSRVFVYEKGLLYTFNVPSYSGNGFRFSAHLRYDFGQRLMLLAKLGHTAYRDRNEISSGNDLIRGNKKTDLQLQVRVKF